VPDPGHGISPAPGEDRTGDEGRGAGNKAEGEGRREGEEPGGWEGRGGGGVESGGEESFLWGRGAK